MHSPSSRLVLPRCAVLGRALRDGAGDFVSHKGTKARRAHWGFLRKAGRHEWAHRGAGIFASRPLHALRGLHGESKRRQRAGLGAGIFTMKSMKGMKVPLHEGLPPLCVLGALVVKTKRRCGVDRCGKFYPKCDDPVPQCSVQRGASRYEVDRCGVQRVGSQCAAGPCSVQRGALTRTIHSFSTLSSSVTLVPPLCKMPLPEVENRG